MPRKACKEGILRDKGIYRSQIYMKMLIISSKAILNGACANFLETREFRFLLLQPIYLTFEISIEWLPHC